MEAMLQLKKIDIAGVPKVYNQQKSTVAGTVSALEPEEVRGSSGFQDLILDNYDPTD